MDTINHEEGQEPQVAATQVAESERLQTLPHYFGRTLMTAEVLVYTWMGDLCEAYDGGSWGFFSLSNGGFYMAPAVRTSFTVRVELNGYEGSMSADAAGITACLFAFCQLANTDCVEQQRFNQLFHQLREFCYGHAEAAEIFSAID